MAQGSGTIEVTMKDYVDAGDAKTRAQNDARFAEVINGIEKVNNNLSALGDTVRIRLDTLDGDVKGAKSASERAEVAADDAKKAASNIKWNIFFTALGVTGIIFVVWQICGGTMARY